MQDTLTLPTLSQGLLDKLHDDTTDMSKFWPMLINECANYYIELGIGHGADYHEIGEKMVLEYPKIMDQGKYPHVRKYII